MGEPGARTGFGPRLQNKKRDSMDKMSVVTGDTKKHAAPAWAGGATGLASALTKVTKGESPLRVNSSC